MRQETGEVHGVSVALPFEVPAHDHLNADRYTAALCNTNQGTRGRAVLMHWSFIFGFHFEIGG